MAISVGSVSVDIVPDARGFAEKVRVELRNISAQVRLDLEDKKFKAEIDAATRDRKVAVKVDDKGSIAKTQGRAHALLTTLTLLAPAAAPLTAVAIAGTAALGGLGAAGILAVKGIQNEMKAGTPAGLVFSGMVKSLHGDLASLEKTAADGIISGFSEAVQVTDDALPQLRTEIGLLSRSLGSDLAPVASGVFALLHDLDPTINSITGGIHELALDFQNWATGPGGVKFASYLATELPQVEKVLASLASAGAHLVTALLPLGGPVLDAIEGISTAISHIPSYVIQDLFVAFAGYETIVLAQKAIEGVTGALVKMGIAEKAAGSGTAIKTLGTGSKLLGSFGLLGAGLLAGYQAINSNVNSRVASQTQTLINNPKALADAQARRATLAAQLKSIRDARANLPGAASAVRGAGGGNSVQGQYDTLTKELKGATAAVNAAKTANVALGLTADGTKDAITGEAVSLSKLITNADKAAAAQQGLYGAQTNVAQAISDANKALKEDGKTLDLHTQKGRDNRTALLNVASAQRAVLDADATTAAGRKHLNADTANSITQLETLAHKMGLSTTAAHNLATALLGLKTVKINFVDAGYGPVKADLANLITLERQASGRGVTKAAGGLLSGPGTGTSDSIVAHVSNGEFVVNANATAKHLALLQKINSSTPAFAGGGRVGYASGGVVDANLSSITSILNNPVTTAAQVASARTAEARATATLAGAEAALQHLRSAKHPDAAAIHAEEKRITADRLALAAATTKLVGAQRSYAAGRSSLATKFANAAGLTARTDAGFLSNLNKISSRGFGFLAQELLAEGDADAMQVAAEFVGWSNSKLSAVQKSLQADSATQAKLQNFGAPPAAASAAPPVQVTQNITTQPGQSNSAIAQVVGNQLAILLTR